MVVAADGTVQPRVIRPGPRELGLRIVRDGLGADDSIIIDGLLRARPGSKVTAQPGKIEPGPDRARWGRHGYATLPLPHRPAALCARAVPLHHPYPRTTTFLPACRSVS